MTTRNIEYFYVYKETKKSLEEVKSYDNKKWRLRNKYCVIKYNTYDFLCSKCNLDKHSMLMKVYESTNENNSENKDNKIYTKGNHAESCIADSLPQKINFKQEILDICNNGNITKKPFIIKQELIAKKGIVLKESHIYQILYQNKKKNTKRVLSNI